MTRAQTIRHECLLQLYGSQSLGSSVTRIVKAVKREGEDFTETEIRDALFFLRGQGFCTQAQEPSTGEVRFTITSAGILEWERTDN